MWLQFVSRRLGEFDIPEGHNSEWCLSRKTFISKGHYSEGFSKGHYSEGFYPQGSFFRISE